MRVIHRSWDNRQRSTKKSRYKTWTRRARWYEANLGEDIRIKYEDAEGDVNVCYKNDKEAALKEYQEFKEEKVTVMMLVNKHYPSKGKRSC